jgi:Zn-dependent peptidase ImmA (M78 family)/transcriptional regulator with XRE-family HTH domain
MTITQEELAKRLREARENAGFTQEDAAKALGLVRPAIAQIEAGKRKVSSLELMALSRLYGRPLHSFFEESFERDGIAFIWRAIPEARKDPAIQKGMGRGIELVNAILDLEKKLGHDRVSSGMLMRYIQRVSKKWEAIVQGQEIAQQERSRLKLGTAPIDNPAAILDSQGILALGIDLPSGISGFTFRSDPAIVCAVNTADAWVRQRYSLVHEYCHALCDIEDLPGIVTRIENAKDDREVRADIFAAYFLMPEEGVKGFLASRGKAAPSRIPAPQIVRDKIIDYKARRKERVREIDFIDVVVMARTFGVSVESAIWRLRNLNLINAEKQEAFLSEEKEGLGKKIIHFFYGPEQPMSKPRRAFLHNAEQRLFSLAMEAVDLDIISRNKLVELLRLTGLSDDEIFEIPQARRSRG